MSEEIQPYHIAKMLHKSYELWAKYHGWGTQESCRVDFDALPTKNKKVMISVAEDIIAKFSKPKPQEASVEEVYRLLKGWQYDSDEEFVWGQAQDILKQFNVTKKEG